MENPVSLGEIVRCQRKSLHLSQENVAELASLHRNYIGQIERNQKEPTLSVFFRLCRAVQLEPDQVVRKIIGQKSFKR